MPLKIGGLEFENNVFLAPMAGVTDKAFRIICREWGCGFVYSEMVSAKGLYYGDKKTVTLMDIDDAEKPCAVQIFGSDPDIMGEIAPRAIETGAAMLDINMGCPTPKIVNNGDGSALMKNPQLAGRIIKSVSNAVNVPVTVKIRKGWDDETVNAVEMAKIAEDNGAAAVTVHGRTRAQFYSGTADWDIIREVKKSVGIPVIANGDVRTAEDCMRILEYTGADGVMIGRGAQGNPFLFHQINELRKYGEVRFVPTVRDRVEEALRHLRMLCEYKGEMRGICESRKHIAWYIKGIPDSARLKEKVFKINNLDEMTAVLNDYIQHYE